MTDKIFMTVNYICDFYDHIIIIKMCTKNMGDCNYNHFTIKYSFIQKNVLMTQ